MAGCWRRPGRWLRDLRAGMTSSDFGIQAGGLAEAVVAQFREAHALAEKPPLASVSRHEDVDLLRERVWAASATGPAAREVR